MLADEVTHVKMGSDWLRRLTANDPERQQAGPRLPAGGRQAVQLRRLPGRAGREPRAPGPQLPPAGRVLRRRDRRPGRHRRRGLRRGRRRPGGRASPPPTAEDGARSTRSTLLHVHTSWAWFVIIGNGLAGAVGARRQLAADAAHAGPVVVHGPGRADDLRAGRPGRRPGRRAELRGPEVPHVLRLRRHHRRRHHLQLPRRRCATGSTCSTASAACSSWASGSGPCWSARPDAGRARAGAGARG